MKRLRELFLESDGQPRPGNGLTAGNGLSAGNGRSGGLTLP
jgi:hypothetical protein